MVSFSFQSKENASPHEDYGHKAMEFFRGRIEQYGDCTAVPIRSLLGEELIDKVTIAYNETAANVE